MQTSLEYASQPAFDIGPRALLGPVWLLIGLPFRAWLTYRHHPGWAGLFVSPYVLYGYLLWPLMELGRHTGGQRPDVNVPEVAGGRPRPDPEAPHARHG